MRQLFLERRLGVKETSSFYPNGSTCSYFEILIRALAWVSGVTASVKADLGHLFALAGMPGIQAAPAVII